MIFKYKRLRRLRPKRIIQEPKEDEVKREAKSHKVHLLKSLDYVRAEVKRMTDEEVDNNFTHESFPWICQFFYKHACKISIKVIE